MTACAIGVQQGDMIMGVFCQNNGEPEYTGSILLNHFDCVKSNTLGRYGDIVMLQPSLQETTFYGRDKGDTESQSEQFFTEEKFRNFYQKHRKASEFYLRTRHGWQYFDKEEDEWVPLSELKLGLLDAVQQVDNCAVYMYTAHFIKHLKGD